MNMQRQMESNILMLGERIESVESSRPDYDHTVKFRGSSKGITVSMQNKVATKTGNNGTWESILGKSDFSKLGAGKFDCKILNTNSSNIMIGFGLLSPDFNQPAFSHNYARMFSCSDCCLYNGGQKLNLDNGNMKNHGPRIENGAVVSVEVCLETGYFSISAGKGRIVSLSLYLELGQISHFIPTVDLYNVNDSVEIAESFRFTTQSQANFLPIILSSPKFDQNLVGIKLSYNNQTATRVPDQKNDFTRGSSWRGLFASPSFAPEGVQKYQIRIINTEHKMIQIGVASENGDRKQAAHEQSNSCMLDCSNREVYVCKGSDRQCSNYSRFKRNYLTEINSGSVITVQVDMNEKKCGIFCE